MPIACNSNNAHVHPKKMDHVRYRCVILKKHQYLVIHYGVLFKILKNKISSRPFDPVVGSNNCWTSVQDPMPDHIVPSL